MQHCTSLPAWCRKSWQHCICQHSARWVTGVNFQYRDPERGFDRGKVKGVVAKLVHLQDPTTTTALEVAAGGKLYQVKVSSIFEHTPHQCRYQLRQFLAQS